MTGADLTIREVQDRAWANKLRQGFSTDDVPLEFCLLFKEAGEALDAWRHDDGHVGEELADVFIFLAGVAEMTGVDLAQAVAAKLAVNEQRTYRALPNGTLVKDKP